MQSISTKNRKARRRTLLLIAAVTLVFALAGGYYFFDKARKAELEKLKATQPSTSAKNQADTEDSKEGLPNNSTDITSEEVPVGEDLRVSITKFAQQDNSVSAAASTNSTGTCVFLYRPGDGGKPVTKEVSVSDNACSSSSPISEFSYIGKWRLTVTYYSNGQKVETAQDVQIR